MTRECDHDSPREYLVCPCCDAGRDAYDAAEAVDPTSAEYVEVLCDDCMGGKACTVPYDDAEPAIPCCQWDPGAPYERMMR